MVSSAFVGFSEVLLFFDRSFSSQVNCTELYADALGVIMSAR